MSMLVRTTRRLRACGGASGLATRVTRASVRLVTLPSHRASSTAAKLSSVALQRKSKSQTMELRCWSRALLLSSTRAMSTEAMTLEDGLRWLRAFAVAKFDETVDVAVKLNIDPRKPDQNVRSVVQLPHAFRDARVAVFARGPKAEEAKEAGADVVGAEDLAEQIQNGKLGYSRVIATPDMMPVVARVARILGPRGLMPNPKVGTITMNVADAVKAAKQGQVAYKADKSGVVHAPIGKVSFTDEQLAENIEAFFVSLSRAKPSGAKGEYVQRITISSTMGKGIRFNPRLAPFDDRARKRQAAMKSASQ